MQKLTQDLTASIVVFLVALPLSMGIALASGVPPALGLITAVLGGWVASLFGGSPLSISGPSAGLMVVVGAMVAEHGPGKLAAAVLLAGLVQLAAGLLRVGRLFQAVSPSVIRGMISGIGILIIASQVHVMIDDQVRASGLENLLALPGGVWKAITDYQDREHDIAAGVGVATLAAVVLWNRIKPPQLQVVPGPLVGAALAAGLAAIFQLPIRYVAVPENLLDIVSFPTLGTVGQMADPIVVGTGLSIAVVATAETLLCATAVARMTESKRPKYDRELTVQGVANLLCGAIGTLPMAGVISRSTANVQAGARTRAAAVLHATWIALFVLLLPNVLELVPTSSLAAILVYVGFKLLDPRAVRAMVPFGWEVVGIVVVTAVAIVVSDLLTGVAIGLVLSAIRILYKMSNVEFHLEVADGRADLHMVGSATFLGLPKLADILDEVPKGTELHLHFDELEFIDHACLDQISAFRQRHATGGGEVVVEWDELFSLQNKSLGDEAKAGSAISLPGDSRPPTPDPEG
ncbi:MAG: SulP family inorganic anion transporter [Sandaracinaceae bacterium]